MPNPPGGSACASRSDGTFDPGADRPPSGGPLQAGPRLTQLRVHWQPVQSLLGNNACRVHRSGLRPDQANQ